MYGIMSQDGKQVLCCRSGTNSYFIKTWDRAGMPAMRQSATEIDKLLQDISTMSLRYDLVVFKFTDEQIADILVRKLKGY